MLRAVVGSHETMTDPRGPFPGAPAAVGLVLMVVGVIMILSIILMPFGLVAVFLGIMSMMRQLEARKPR